MSLGHIAVGRQPAVARVTGDGKVVAVANRGDDSVTLIDGAAMRVRATLHVCKAPDSLVILPDDSKAVVGCSGSRQVAMVNLKNGFVESLLQVGGTPVDLAMKPDGGEVFVSNYEAGTISVVSPYAGEIDESFLAGDHPVRALVSGDNSTLYVSNFASNSVAVFDASTRKLITSVGVGFQSRRAGAVAGRDHAAGRRFGLGRRGCSAAE